MNQAQAQVDFMALDLTILEQAVPAHMLLMMLEEVQKNGYEVREDVLHHLRNAVLAPLSRLDTFSVARVAKRIDDTARSILREVSPDNPLDGLYSCAQFILTLIDEGRWTDAQNQAVLMSLLLMEDVKDDRKDRYGNEAVWRVEEKKWQKAAKEMLKRAMLLGLYAMPARI